MLTPEKIDELADKIYKLFRKYDMWCDSQIYFNGKCLSNKDYAGHYHYDGSAYIYEDRDPKDYFECVNPEHILSMGFEGPIYHMFNYNKYGSVLKKFKALLEKYGLYYEQGDAWNLTCYYIQKK